MDQVGILFCGYMWCGVESVWVARQHFCSLNVQNSNFTPCVEVSGFFTHIYLHSIRIAIARISNVATHWFLAALLTMSCPAPSPIATSADANISVFVRFRPRPNPFSGVHTRPCVTVTQEAGTEAGAYLKLQSVVEYIIYCEYYLIVPEHIPVDVFYASIWNYDPVLEEVVELVVLMAGIERDIRARDRKYTYNTRASERSWK